MNVLTCFLLILVISYIQLNQGQKILYLIIRYFLKYELRVYGENYCKIKKNIIYLMFELMWFYIDLMNKYFYVNTYGKK